MAMNRPRGFTLVEVLVALVVMAVLAGLAWQAVDGMVRSRESVQANIDRSVTLNTALAQWETDLQDLVADAPTNPLHFDGVRMRLLRRSPQGIQLVVWSLRQGQWQRWAAAPTTQEVALVQSWSVAPQLTGREPGYVTLAQGLTAWQLYFYRGNAWTNAQSSGDLVASGVAASQGNAALPPRERLPMGVRLVMTMDGPSGRGTLTRDILVPGGMP